MNSRVLSSSILGIDAYIVDVECNLSRAQLPRYVTVGLPDNAVKESKERVTSAINNSGYTFPRKHITINLAPADIRKEGSAFDLPIAIGILAASGIVKHAYLDKLILLGELALDGTLRPIKGVLPITINAKREGISGIILPKENAREASVVDGIKVASVRSLNDVVAILNGDLKIAAEALDRTSYFNKQRKYTIDFEDVKG